MQGKIVDVEVTFESDGKEDFKNDKKHLKKMLLRYNELSLRGRVAIVNSLQQLLLKELEVNANS